MNKQKRNRKKNKEKGQENIPAATGEQELTAIIQAQDNFTAEEETKIEEVKEAVEEPEPTEAQIDQILIEAADVPNSEAASDIVYTVEHFEEKGVQVEQVDPLTSNMAGAGGDKEMIDSTNFFEKNSPRILIDQFDSPKKTAKEVD